MDIQESANLLVQEILHHRGISAVPVSKIVKILSIIYTEVPRSIVEEIVDDALDHQARILRDH